MTSTDSERKKLSLASSLPPSSTVRIWQRHYRRALLIADFVAVLIGITAAQILRFGVPTSSQHAQRGDYLWVSAIIAVCWLCALSMNNSRSHRVIGAGAEEYRRVWLGTVWVFGSVAIVSMLFKLEIARGYLMIAMPAGLTLLVLFRWLARRVVARQREKYNNCLTPVLIVGSLRAGLDVAVAMIREPAFGYRISGFWLPDTDDGPRTVDVPGIGTVPAFGSESSVLDAAAATNCHVVAVAATDRLDGADLRKLSWELDQVDVDMLVSPGVVDVAGPRLHMSPVAGLPLIHVDKPQYHGAKRLQKRLFDLGFSGTVLVLGAPLLAAIALAIKLTSKGPVFYRQERIGLDGEPFKVIKFRTMVDGADARAHELLTLNLVASPRDPLKF